MAQIDVYTKGYCPFCHRVVALFDKLGVEYNNIDVEHDDEKFMEMVERANGGRTVPQVFINGEHIGGCDDTFALHQQGLLEEKISA